MQTKALFAAYFWNDSSSSCTREPYWSGSISAGTPGGYDLSQILSIGCLCLQWYLFCVGGPTEKTHGRA
jgi:hypothetical protein